MLTGCLTEVKLWAIDEPEGGAGMRILKRLLRASLGWAVANPARAAELTISLILLGATLATTRRFDRSLLRRLVRAFL